MDVQLIPALQDNYIFALIGDNQTWIVDPGEAAPVLEFLKHHRQKLAGILITHHHADHVGGVPEILARHPAPVTVPAKDRGRWDFATNFVEDGDVVRCGSATFEVWSLPGHTLDHTAYVERERGWLFSGDVLFGLGCGRLFEGTHRMMFDSLARIKTLEDRFLVYCAHEYTQTNVNFTRTLGTEPGDLAAYAREVADLRARNQPSVPRGLGAEKKLSPFLRAATVEEFKSVRDRRDSYRG